MYKILLLGSTGKIGQHVLKELLKYKEFDVRVLSRRDLVKLNSKVVLYRGDINDVVSLYSAIEWSDIVVNCAGFVSYKTKDYDFLKQINIEGTKNILSVCAKYKKLLLHTSSAVVYGSSKGPIAYDEMHKDTGAYLSGYAKSKLSADQLILQSPVRSLILRPSTLISPNGSTFAKLLALYRQGFQADLKGGASFASPDNIAQAYGPAILYLIRQESKNTIFNVGGTNILINEVFNFFTENEPRKTVYISNAVLRQLSWINDKLLLPVFRRSVITQENYLTGSRFTYICSEKAKRELGYIITPFAETAIKILKHAHHG